jgi:hypothetical protein
MKRGILLGSGFFVLALVLGCGNKTSEFEITKESGENQFAVILGQLQVDRPTMTIYRSVVEQLSTYFDNQGPDYKAKIKLDTADAALVDQLLANLNRTDKAARLDDVKNHYFNTLADASHLDGCLVFRDAARELASNIGEPPASNAPEFQTYQLEITRHMFGWTARQVTTLSHQGNFKNWPAHEILRVGAGDAEDRVRVFLGLAGQSQHDLDACAILVKRQERHDDQVVTRSVPVLAGVLIGKAIYVFDPIHGVAIPGPDGKGVATLDQVRKSPELLKGMKEVPTAAQLTEAEVVLMASLSGMAPRMKVLQTEMEKLNNRVKLTEDLAVRLKRFQDAGVPARPWADTSRPGYPALATHRYVESSKGDPRVEVIVRRDKLIPKWAIDADKEILPAGSTGITLLTDFDRQFIALRLEPGGGRDLIVRGNALQAVMKLNQTESILEKSLDQFHREIGSSLVPIRETQVLGFRHKSREIKQLAAQMMQTPSGSAERARLEQRFNEARAAYDKMWSEQAIRGAIMNMNRDWAMPELREHLIYFMGLAKLELAIRAELRYRRDPKAAWPEDLPRPVEQFASAADWFRRYEAIIVPTGGGIWLAAVSELRQFCDKKVQELRTVTAATQ